MLIEAARDADHAQHRRALGAGHMAHCRLTSRCQRTDTRAFYASLSPSELSLRFTRPEIYDGLDDFARPNALEEILNRRLLSRGMHVDAVRHVLGHADLSITAEGRSDIMLGQPFAWHYDGLFSSS
jgi:hypothetical protein